MPFSKPCTEPRRRFFDEQVRQLVLTLLTKHNETKRRSCSGKVPEASSRVLQDSLGPLGMISRPASSSEPGRDRWDEDAGSTEYWL